MSKILILKVEITDDLAKRNNEIVSDLDEITALKVNMEKAVDHFIENFDSLPEKIEWTNGASKTGHEA